MDTTAIIASLKGILTVVLSNARNLIMTVANVIYPGAPEMAAIGLILVAVYLLREKMTWWMWFGVVALGAYIFIGGF